MRKILSLISFLSLATLAGAQQIDSLSIDSNDEAPVFIKPDNTVPWKLGVKFGGGVSTIIGDEVKAPSAAYSLNGGMYVRHRFPKKFIFQSEFTVSMRGSNFNNSTGQYQLIRLYYLDLPLLLCYSLNQTRNSNLVAGMQYSYLISSLLFVDMNPPMPEEGTPRMRKHDIAAVAGFQFYTPYVGFQLLGKYGLVNINNGLLPGVLPVNQGRSMHNMTFEFNFIF